jgi:hypothetical protein
MNTKFLPLNLMGRNHLGDRLIQDDITMEIKSTA